MIPGFDVSFSRVWTEDFLDFKTWGQRYLIQCAWTGGYAGNAGIRQVCEANLRSARIAQLPRTIYINANPWFKPAQSITEARANCGDEWRQGWWENPATGKQLVFVDDEIAGTTEADLRNLCEALEVEGFEVYIYSAHWYWVGVRGNPQWPWLLKYRLWVAFYDNDPDWDFASHPWGPWTPAHVAGEQFTNTQNVIVNGRTIQLDYDSFDPALLVEEDEVITPPLRFIKAPGNGTTYITDGIVRKGTPTPQIITDLVNTGLAEGTPGDPATPKIYEVAQAFIDWLPDYAASHEGSVVGGTYTLVPVDD